MKRLWEMLVLAVLGVSLFITSVVSISYGKTYIEGDITYVRVSDCNGYILRPHTELYPAGSHPWLWFAPELGRSPHTNRMWLFNKLLLEGWTIAAVNIGEARGNPEGRIKFTDFYNYLMNSDFGLQPKANLFVQSRGGLMHYNWAADHPKWVQSIGGIYPAVDLRSYPGLAKAAPVFKMTVEELEANLSDCNPINRLAPLAAENISILHLHGDSDKLVPLKENSAAVKKRYDKLGGDMRLIVVSGKGHEVVPEFFESADLYNFFYSQAPVGMLENASNITDCKIPSVVEGGAKFTVEITIRNEGTQTWTFADGYVLATGDDSGLFTSSSQHYLTPQDSITTGKSKTFRFQMTAPTPKDNRCYKITWQMLKEDAGRFGEIVEEQVCIIDKSRSR